MTDVEVITPEVVEAPGTAVERAPDAGRDSALVAAAEAALASPDAIDHGEFWALAAQARILCMSGAAPKAIRQDPHLALHLALVGRDLGISPSASLELIDVIKVRDGEYRLSLSPQLMNGQLRRLGIGCILPMERTNLRCVAVAFGPEGPDRSCTRTGVVAHVEGCACDVIGVSEFTWEDAQIAELAGPNCKPGQHVKDQSRSSGGRTWKVCGCNQGYITYPKRMLWWRASGFAADDYFPEAGLGMYSPEALGADVGADGRPVDVDSVELPPGYEPAQLPAARQQAERQAAADQPAPAAELLELQLMIRALPEGLRLELAGVWKEHEKLRPHAVWKLPKRLTATARAMATARWAQATQLGVDRDSSIQALREGLGAVVASLTWVGPVLAGEDAGNSTASAVPAAQERPEEPPGPEVPAEPATGHTEPPAEPEFDVDGDGNQVPHPEGRAGLVRGVEPDVNPEDARDWRPVMRQVAQDVIDLTAGLPPGIGQRIGEAVAQMHHTAVNKVIAHAEEDGTYPPDSPIGLRRMAATFLLCTAFQTTGEIPAMVVEVEAK